MSESTSSAYPSTYIDLQPGTTERLATSYRRFSDLRSKGECHTMFTKTISAQIDDKARQLWSQTTS